MAGSQNSLRVISGGSTPKKYARKAKGEAEQAVCRVCEQDTGVASSVWTKVRLAPRTSGGKIVGGTEALVCALCLARGKVTRLT